MISKRIVQALTIAAGVGFCGSSALADLAFSPPAGWSSGGGRVAGHPVNIWRAPKAVGGFAQDISVVQDRYKGTLAQYVALNSATLAKNPGVKIASSPLALCNGIAATMLQFTAKSGARDVAAKQLYTTVDGMFYVITYARTAGEAEAPEAVKSLTSACPRAAAVKATK